MHPSVWSPLYIPYFVPTAVDNPFYAFFIRFRSILFCDRKVIRRSINWFAAEHTHTHAQFTHELTFKCAYYLRLIVCIQYLLLVRPKQRRLLHVHCTFIKITFSLFAQFEFFFENLLLLIQSFIVVDFMQMICSDVCLCLCLPHTLHSIVSHNFSLTRVVVCFVSFLLFNVEVRLSK